MAKPTILLIDYDPKSIEKTRRPLEDAGYRVETANDGIAGLAAFENLQPALVLIEAMIPKKHGFEVCQEIKKSARGKTTPVIITTAVYRGRKYKTQAKHIYGADDYLEKPVDDALLLETCRKHLPEDAASGSSEEDASPAVPPQAKAVAAAGAGPRHRDLQADWTEEEIEARLSEILPGLGGETHPAASEPAPPAEASVQAAAEEAAEAAPGSPAPSTAEPPSSETAVEQAPSSEGAPVVPFDPERRSRRKRKPEQDTRPQDDRPEPPEQEAPDAERAAGDTPPSPPEPPEEVAEAEAVQMDEPSSPPHEPQARTTADAAEMDTPGGPEAAGPTAEEPPGAHPPRENAGESPEDVREDRPEASPEPAPPEGAGVAVTDTPPAPAPVEEDRAHETPGDPEPTRAAGLPEAAPASPNRVLVWVAAAAAILVVAAAAFFLMRGGDEAPSSDLPASLEPAPERLAVSDEPDLAPFDDAPSLEGGGTPLAEPDASSLPPSESVPGDARRESAGLGAAPAPAEPAAVPAEAAALVEPAVTPPPPARSEVSSPRPQPTPEAGGGTRSEPAAALPAVPSSRNRVEPAQTDTMPAPAARKNDPPPSSPAESGPSDTPAEPAPSAAGSSASSDTPEEPTQPAATGQHSPTPSEAETLRRPPASTPASTTASRPSSGAPAPGMESREPRAGSAAPPEPRPSAGTLAAPAAATSSQEPEGEKRPAIRPGALVEITEVDREPIPKRHDAPPYTLRARRLRQEGTVYLNVLVNEKGRVESVEVIKGIPGSDLDESAADTARRWTYEPAVKDGVPVKVWKVEKVVFQL